MNVAVVGAGIDGASAARHLAVRGHRTVLFERFPFGHAKGSSHGNSRIVRRTYPDAHYTGIMMEAYPMWAELQTASGVELLHETGLLYFGDAQSPKIRSVVDSLQTLKVEHAVLDPVAAKKIFLQLHLDPHEVGVWTSEAGWVHAGLAVKATIDLARAAGAELRPESLATRDALEGSFDAFVVCPGAWIKDWVDVPVGVSLQTYGYIRAQMQGPVWIEATDDGPYGFPSEGVNGFKLGIHRLGRQVAPDDLDRSPSGEVVRQIEETATKRFGIRAPKVDSATGCLYTSTADEDFLLGRIGEKGYFASACSGHGFKFGPWIGKLLADFVEGKDEPEDHPRFFWQATGPQ